MNGQTILVVEDERPLLEAIKLKLMQNGLDVVTARTVDQAIGYLADLRIDAIWLDHYLLGKKDGLDLVAHMKSKGSTWEHIPLFVVSNTASEDKVRTYIEFGIEKYFVKADIRLDQIINYILEYLNHGPTRKSG